MSIRTLDKNISDPVEMVNLVRKGINFSLFEKISARLGLSIKQWCSILHLTERTIQRYRIDQKTFESIHSEKIIAIVRLFKQGVEVFGSVEKFSAWMNSNIVFFGGIKPITLLDTGIGIDLINDELIRIEHGVFA